MTPTRSAESRVCAWRELQGGLPARRGLGSAPSSVLRALATARVPSRLWHPDIRDN